MINGSFTIPSHSVVRPWWTGRCRTPLLLAALTLLNVGVFPAAPPPTRDWLTRLEFDGAAIRQGQLWRLVTCNLVHYDTRHFLLDVGVFLVLGLVYEPYFRRAFLWLLLTMCVAIGLTTFSFMDENNRMRGLSGVDCGLFAVALCVEFGLARKDPSRWWWLAPAAILFAIKTIYETATGESLLGTEVLLGPTQLATTAHLAGVVSGLAFATATTRTK